jgi:hypothetical protein
MTCACEREAEFDTAEADGGENGPQFYTIVANGKRCFECETFTCNVCIARAVSIDSSHDPSLCLWCNVLASVREPLLERAS